MSEVKKLLDTLHRRSTMILELASISRTDLKSHFDLTDEEFVRIAAEAAGPIGDGLLGAMPDLPDVLTQGFKHTAKPSRAVQREQPRHTCTVVLTVVGTKDEALAACAARDLHPWDDTVVEQDDGTCLVESPLQESALEKASAWFWEDYYEPHPVGTLVAISADSRRPIVRKVTS